MEGVYFDACSIPIFILILIACRIRRMTRGRSNHSFILVTLVSLACAVVDMIMGLLISHTPLSAGRLGLLTILYNLYFALRNGSSVLCLLLLFDVTRTTFHLRGVVRKLLLVAPYGVVLVALMQNAVTQNVFVLTAAEGYSRGPMMVLLYAISFAYGLAGLIYCIYCSRYLTASRWISLSSIFILNFAGVLIQLLWHNLQVEMFCTSVSLLMILLMVIRPEETVDASVGLESWPVYLNDVKHILEWGHHVQIAVVQLLNAEDIRTYLGEEKFNAYLREIVDEIWIWHRHCLGEIGMYYERPGFLYLIMENPQVDVMGATPMLLQKVRERVREYADTGARLQPKICILRVPEDLNALEDILNLGHKFPELCPHDQEIVLAADIVKSRDFEIINHMEEILNRAVTENSLVMYYQPIYDIRSGKFRSAEALARLFDSKYGMIPPSMFIPAAESAGLILPVGDTVLESVYRFISGHDLEALGLNYIEINLSVAQCLQADLPEAISSLQAKYGVRPDQVNFEITETLFGDLSNIMSRNLRVLSGMGYKFSLDDYGVGYSNIQRLTRLPLNIIKIDKSLVDGMFSDSGSVIIQNTVSMMQGINKALVMEGVETLDAVEACKGMSCDFIQGYYFSKPLPADDFVEFLKKNNVEGGAVA